MLAGIYGPQGARAFDSKVVGEKMFRAPLSVESRAIEDMPDPRDATVRLGRHLDGCRIGFDLGGSDRKCVAVVEGEVVFSEETRWDPYFQSEPRYHFDGIDDTLRRAATRLPRIDAIGGSAAGVYANNEVLVASLFRGVSDRDFETHIRRMFWRLKEKWDDVPLEVANDGEVAALAGSMSLNENRLLGISMGTSQAAGYCDSTGHITSWLNELAFTPIDYRDDAPADEVVGRYRLRSPVLLSAGRGPAGPNGRHRSPRGRATVRMSQRGSGSHGARRRASAANLRDYRRLLGPHDSVVLRVLRGTEFADHGGRDVG